MSTADAVQWLAAGALGVLLIAVFWRLASRAMARRARQLRHQRVAHSRPQRLGTQSGTVSTGMGPERATAIRRDAENAARLVASGEVSEVLSRHPQGSQEHVLWVATYHLTMTELAEAAEEQGAAAVAMPAPAAAERGVSPP
jgi:hypothetical protein